jgi:tRNA threonylcarbamoyladenosine biosynthesis protein TsaB
MRSDRTILALDTSTNVQAIALLDGERLLEDRSRRVPFNHSSSLLANVDETLQAHEHEPEDLDAIAVGIGPGSFTGTRISLALAKALARRLDVPLVGISTLAAVAYRPACTHPDATVIAALNAGRHEVYAGTYTACDGNLQQLEEDRLQGVDTVVEALEKRRADGASVVVVGSAVEAYDAFDELHRDIVVMEPSLGSPCALAVAHLGRDRLIASNGEGDALHELEPNYIRPSSAEENLKAGKLDVSGL